MTRYQTEMKVSATIEADTPEAARAQLFRDVFKGWGEHEHIPYSIGIDSQPEAQPGPPVPAQCPGTGQRWGTCNGQPLCLVCHRRVKSMSVAAPQPVRRPRWIGGRGWQGTIPPHPVRQP
jgi:hypothetical protein